MHRPCRPHRAAIAAVLSLLTAAPAAAEIIPAAQQARGLSINQAQCAALPYAVWVGAMGQSFCIRYYPSGAGGSGTRPVVFLQGDATWPYDKRTNTLTPQADAKDINTENLTRSADGFSRATKTAAMYLARPGMDGSSGLHVDRHTFLELYAVNAALDAVKQRYGFQGFHLIGQSGGAILTGGLLALRRDIGCAVPGAGRLAQMFAQGPMALNAKFYSSADVADVVARNGARILVVDDPLDTTTVWSNDTIFVDKVLHAGGRVELFPVKATDDNHHGVVRYATAALAGCLRGASHQEIATDITRVQQQVFAAKAQTPVQRVQ